MEDFSQNITKVKISNYSAILSLQAVRYSNEQYFSFKTDDGVISKIMFSSNFYDDDSMQYHKVMLQEKLNGSHIELYKQKNKMKDIFEFNHIDKSLSESDVKTLKDFYKHYHKKYWCFKKSYKSYKFLDDVFTISGICLVAIGTISGGITLNPVVLGVVNGAGLIVAGIGKKNNYKRKIEMTRIAFTNYEKVLVELRSALRGDDFNKEEFVDRMKLIDEMIIDQTPIADRFVSRYEKKFGLSKQ